MLAEASGVEMEIVPFRVRFPDANKSKFFDVLR